MDAQPPPDDRREIRISHTDRERAAERLQRALSEGRITMGELEERLSVVYAARFGADLVPPLADLPGDPLDLRTEQLSTPVGPPTVLRTGMSSLRRTGDWQVPARLRVQSSMGSVLLDFCDATFAHPVIEVELQLGAGSARLLVPDDASADLDKMETSMGSVRTKVSGRAAHGHPHFRIYGRANMGSVTVRRRYHFAGRHF